MDCPQCCHANVADARFCNACGARLEAVCSTCGQANPPGSRFCSGCGAPLTGAAPPSAAAPAPAAPSYTPRHLAERILTNRSALEGERKQVTVLFADIADSSTLAQRLDPEVMHVLLDQVLRLIAETVHRYEGTVNQYLGDGVMALFGAPVALEDHAFRAVQAALTVQETIAGYSARLEQEHGVGVRLRVGVNTGLVVVGRIGDDLRMDYTAVGNVTHLASRMQALAAPGTINITEHTCRLVAEYVHAEDGGPIEVRGQREPVRVYRVTGRRRWRTRLEIRAEHGLTPLVARQRELGTLTECFARARAGRGQVVGLIGEAGVGKSRLLYEFHASLGGEPFQWLTGNCVAHGRTTPYLPQLEILRASFLIEEDDHPLQIQEKLRRGIAGLDPALSRTLPFLEALLGVPGAAEALRHLPPKDQRQQTFEAIRALAIVGSQRRPLVLVYENLHWIDQTSEDCLAFLIESVAAFPIMVITTQRPGYTARWADKTYYSQVSPDLLPEAGVEAMIKALLGAPTVPPALARFIWDKASGNPLFVEEVVRALGERGLIGRDDGAVTWSGTADVPFPDTIQDIMRARIDGLQDRVKRTVQTAAVVGREFGVGLLARISERADELTRDLEMLKRAELIHESHVFPELSYRFKHAAIQDVAYESLLVQRRQALHGAIGQAIEELYADRLEEQAAILAYHYAHSLHQDRAMTYALLAGDRAARLHANAEATTYYEQALAVARTLPPSPEVQRAHIDGVLKLAAVGLTRDDLERDRRNLDAVLPLAEALGDDRRLAQVRYWQARVPYALGDLDSALGYARESQAIADRLGDDDLAAPAVNLMGRMAFVLCDYVNAGQLLARSLAQMRRLGNKTEEATAAGFLGMNMASLGDFAEARAYGDEALRLARELGNPFAEAAAYFYRAWYHDQRGEWALAIVDYDASLRIADRAGDLMRIYLIKFFQGRAHVRLGQTAPGRSLIEASLALGAQLRTTFGVARVRAFLADCLLAGGEAEAALAQSRQAITAGTETREPFGRALGERTLAEAAAVLNPDDVETSERAMREAIRIQDEIRVRPELARSYARYARLLHGWGAAAKAEDYLALAIGMFRQMEMTWDLGEAETLRRRLAGGP
jgi:class 3 adenylate cyclase/tetratricopeptide (TPR) repeat protein